MSGKAEGSGLYAVRGTPLSISEAFNAIRANEVGGVAMFVGTVRDHNDGRPVSLLEYQAYEAMAVKQMERIGRRIQEETPGVRLCALHRVGALEVGETAVICVAGAAHRDEAFSACRRLIDRIKDEVPVWKREHGPDGPYWVGWEDARCRHEEHAHDSDSFSEATDTRGVSS